MKYIIDEEDIKKIAEDLLPAVFVENDKFNKVKGEIKEYLNSNVDISSSFVDKVEEALTMGYYDKSVGIIKDIIKKNGEVIKDNISEIRRLVKEKKWNELDVMFGFDSPADHDRNREDMKCRF